jgi:hypothetical protein
MVKVSLLHSSTAFWLTTVYGLTDDARKDEFLHELNTTAPPARQPWILNGDFNIIYEVRGKSKTNINRRIIGKFRVAIEQAGLREIKCKEGSHGAMTARTPLSLASTNSSVIWIGRPSSPSTH